MRSPFLILVFLLFIVGKEGNSQEKIKSLEDSTNLQRINLKVGEGEVINLQKLKRIVITNPKIADITPLSENELLIIGKEEGSTSLFVWHGEEEKKMAYRIKVNSLNEEDIAEFKALFSPFLKAKPEFVSGKLLLKGPITTDERVEKVLKLASGIYPKDKIINLLTPSQPLQVLTHVEFIQVNRSALERWGIKWLAGYAEEDKSIKVTTNMLSYPANIGVIAENARKFLQMDIEALKKKGELKFLASPSLVTRSGQEASLNIGGRFPIPISSIDPSGVRTTSIQWAEWGINMKLTPKVIEVEEKPEGAKNYLELNITMSISRPDWAKTIQSVPALEEKRVETKVVATSGDTVVISGLLSEEEAKRESRIPILSSIPILGWLFRERVKEIETQELVILITPEIIKEPKGVVLERREAPSLFIKEKGEEAIKRWKLLPSLPPAPSVPSLKEEKEVKPPLKLPLLPPEKEEKRKEEVIFAPPILIPEEDLKSPATTLRNY